MRSHTTSGLLWQVAALIRAAVINAHAGAGTKNAPPSTPTTPLEQFEAQLKQLDTKAGAVRAVRPGSRDDEAVVIVQNGFHRLDYQTRLQGAQGLWAIWKTIVDSPTAALVLVDRAGNRVGRVGPTGNAWVQTP